MNLTIGDRTFFRARDLALVISIIMLVVASISLVYNGLTYYKEAYRNPGIDSGETAIFTFKSGSSQPYADVKLKPISGEFDYGLIHTKGNSSMRYTSKFKNVTASSFTTLYSNGYLSSLNKRYGPYGHIKVYANKTYIFRILKNNYYSSESKMKVDYMIH